MKKLVIVIFFLVALVLAEKQQSSPSDIRCTKTTISSEKKTDCINSGIVCPEVDGRDSVYGALPNCSQFCQCSNGIPYLHNCPDGLHFNPKLNVCDWPTNAGCTGKSTSSQENNEEGDTSSINCDHNNSNTDTNACTNSGLVCPAVDGKDSVYGALPNCSQFCQCSNGIPYIHNCPDGLHFNPKLNVCDWPTITGCTAKSNLSQENNKVHDTSITNSDDNNFSTDTNACTNSGLVCPAVDGKDSVYGALPNCSQFCQCSNGIPYIHNCPDGLHFNPKLNVCDWPTIAGCTAKSNLSQENNKVQDTSITYSDDNNSRTDTNACSNSGLVCPAVDGKDSVYGALPNCSQFCQCSNGIPYIYNCPDGLHFNPKLNVCDWPTIAGCTAKSNLSQENNKVQDTSITYSDDNNSRTDNACTNSGLVCPAVDGEDSVYGALPNCSQFCQCSNVISYLHNCPDGLHFNPKLNVCDWPSNARCTEKSHSSQTNVNNSDYDCEANPKDYSDIDHCIGIECPDIEGRYPVFAPSTNCSQFCTCYSGKVYLVNCPPELYFNQVLNRCDSYADC